MESREKKVAIGGGEDVTTVFYPAARQGKLDATFVFAHGAGASQRHPFMVTCAEGLAARGIDVVTFNFLYTEIGKKSPDPQAALERCAHAVITAVAPGADSTFLGGKSLGGRIASHLVASGQSARGLIFFGYPLHAPGKAELRTAHWDKITTPSLFVQGTRDPFGSPTELAAQTSLLGGPAKIVAVEGGDHSWEVPKRMGMSEKEVIARALDATTLWVRERMAEPARES